MTITKTITRAANTTAYSTGDVINGSGLTTPIEFDFGGLKDGSIVYAHLMSSNEASTPAINVIFFNESFTIASDNDAFAPSDSQIKTRIGKIQFTDWEAYAANKVSDGAPIGPIGIPQPSLSGTTLSGGKVYAVLVAAGAYTPISGEEITLKIDVI